MFQWKEEYRIDGDAIDHDHQYLLDLANRVMAIEDPETEFEKVGEAVHDVYEYMGHHFENEQKKMEETGYPELEEHTEKHKELISKVNAMLAGYRDMKSLSEKFCEIMADWVIDHIMSEDKKFATYMQTVYMQNKVPAGV